MKNCTSTRVSSRMESQTTPVSVNKVSDILHGSGFFFNPSSDAIDFAYKEMGTGLCQCSCWDQPRRVLARGSCWLTQGQTDAALGARINLTPWPDWYRLGEGLPSL